MLKHLKIHLNIRDHKCHICPKDFIDSSSKCSSFIMLSVKPKCVSCRSEATHDDAQW
jgi:hypothetical protein